MWASAPVDRMASVVRMAFEPLGPMQRVGEGPMAGLAREEVLRVANQTCRDGIAHRQSWYSPVLRTPNAALSDYRIASTVTPSPGKGYRGGSVQRLVKLG